MVVVVSVATGIFLFGSMVVSLITLSTFAYSQAKLQQSMQYQEW